MSKTTTKQTAKDHGVPEPYLGPTGNFGIGRDSTLKADLCYVLATGESRPGALHDFSTKAGLALAKRLIKLRGWEAHAARKLAIVEAERLGKPAKTVTPDSIGKVVAKPTAAKPVARKPATRRRKKVTA